MSILTQEDYRSARNILRFAGMGVVPAEETVGRLVDIVSPHLAQMPELRGALEHVRSGVLPSQDDCEKAAARLSQYYGGQRIDDIDVSRMTEH